MHLPQIAALPKVTEDLAEPGHAAHSALEGDGFLSVFSDSAVDGMVESPDSEVAQMGKLAPASLAEAAHASGIPMPGQVAPDAQIRIPAFSEQGAEGDDIATGTEPPRAGHVPAPADPGEVPGGDANDPGPDQGADQGVDQGADQGVGPGVDQGADPSANKVQPALDDAVVTPSPFSLADNAALNGGALAGVAEPAVLPGAAAPLPVSDSRTRVSPSDGTKQASAHGLGSAPKGADAWNDAGIAVQAERSAPRRDLNAPGTGREIAAQILGAAGPDITRSDITRPDGTNKATPADAVPDETPPTMADQNERRAVTRGPEQLASVARDASRALPDGPLRLDGNASGQPSGPGPHGEATPAAARLDAVRPANWAGSGQMMPTVNATQSLADTQELAREPRGDRADTRLTPETPKPAPQSTPKAGSSGALSFAAGVTQGGLGTDPGAAALGGDPGASGAGEGLFGADQTEPDLVLGESRAVSRSAAAGTVPVFQAAQSPRLVSLQIAEVVRASGDRAVELKLQPEELGRVHLTMSQDATGTLTVALNVERADTLELLRRNINLLGADLQALGYESIDFSFQGDGAGAQQDARPGWGDRSGALEVDPADTNGNPPKTSLRGADASGNGIDIRL